MANRRDPNPNSWDPKVDPIVAPGPTGTGTARTRSGRLVNTTFGAYVSSDDNVNKAGGRYGGKPAGRVNRGAAFTSNAGHPDQPKHPVTPSYPNHLPGNSSGAVAPDDKRRLAAVPKPGKDGTTDIYQTLINRGANIGSLVDPNLAETSAAGQWDPIINDYLEQLKMLPGQVKQNKADISNWMDQVLGSLDTGTTRLKTSYDNAANSAASTASGILASLGGGASGSPELTQAGANAASMMQALKANAGTFSDDMKPLLELQRTADLNNQTANQDYQTRTLRSQLSGAQSSKAGAAADLQMQIQQLNNALLQQRFQNAFGVQQAKDAASVASGQNTLNSLYKTAQLTKLLQTLKNPKPATGSYAGTTPGQRSSIASNIINSIQAFRQQNPDAGAGMLVGMVNAMLGSTGWKLNDPGVSNWRNSLFNQLGINPTTQSFNTVP